MPRKDREAYNRRQKEQRRRRQAREGKDYHKLLETQHGVCAICGLPPTKWQLCMDHDHATGFQRGLLCHSCNMALGLFKDSPDRLRAAAEYLEDWEAMEAMANINEEPLAVLVKLIS